MSRFDYVKYDDKATAMQAILKNEFMRLDALIESALPPGRSKSLIFTKLEEAYMWCGKSLRDAQIARNAETELQEQRKDS